MNIIDNKGRLFGWINLIDFICVLSVLLFAFVFVFAGKIKKSVVKDDVFYAVEDSFFCRFVDISPGDVDILKAGMKDTDADGTVCGEILKAGLAKAMEFRLPVNERGAPYVIKTSRLMQLEAVVRLKLQVNNGKFYYRRNYSFADSRLPFFINGKPFLFEVVGIFNAETRNEHTSSQLFECMFINLDPEEAALIKPGLKDTDNDGMVFGEILEAEEAEPYELKVLLHGSNEEIVVRSDNRKQVKAVVRLKLKSEEDQLFYRGWHQLKDQPLPFFINGRQVLFILREPRESQCWAKITVRFSSLMPEIARLIKPGDFERDDTGNSITKVNNVLDRKKSVIMASEEGSAMIFSNPNRMDLTVELSVLCLKRNGMFYLKKGPLKIGNVLVFSPQKYNISGVIIDIQEE